MKTKLEWIGGESSQVALIGGRLVDPRESIDRPADLLIKDGAIAAISEPGQLGVTDGVEVVNVEGSLVMPAFTDPHVHFRAPGQEHKETIATGTAAAAAGGYCAVIAMPNTSPAVDGAELLRGLLARASAEAVVPMGQMAAITRGLDGAELTEMALIREAGAAGFTDDGMPVIDAGVLRKAMRYQSVTGATLALHEEDPSLSLWAPLNEGAVSALTGLTGSPGIAEAAMIARDCLIAELEDASIQVQHLSCRESVEVVAAAKARGVRVTAEVTPHHLLLNEHAAETLDTRAKMNPPLRFEEDRLALIAGLLDGTIDCVATDHAPHSADEKAQPFESAPFGVTGLETAFAALYDELVVRGGIDLGILVERMTSGCEPFGIPAPRLAVGQPANITVFDPTKPWVADERPWRSASSNSCFAGRRFEGDIVLTIVAGVVVHRADRIGDPR
jgi:dihydroorotase